LLHDFTTYFKIWNDMIYFS